MHTVWVTGEIAEIGQSRGHHYLDIVEKDPETNQIIAKSAAIIWQNDYKNLYRKIGKQVHSLLRPGIKVLMNVKVEFHERFGLKLSIRDIDPIFTIGQLESERQQTLTAIKQLGILDKNKSKRLPVVAQRIAVISSENAAGLQDFLQQLKGNTHGFHFKCTLLNASVQGVKAKQDIIKRLKEIVVKQDQFDVVVIIRGGGAKLDLIAFDDLDICKLVADCPIPVLTGIGHETDDTIVDRVAYQAHKTPTAVADFLIDCALQFQTGLSRITSRLAMSSRQLVSTQQLRLQQVLHRMKYGSSQLLSQQVMMLDYVDDQLPKTVKARLDAEVQQLTLISKQLQLLSPELALKRGFTITTINGKRIKNIELIKSGDVLDTRTSDGSIQSIIP